MDTESEIEVSELKLQLIEISNAIDTVLTQLLWLKVIIDQTLDGECLEIEQVCDEV